MAAAAIAARIRLPRAVRGEDAGAGALAFDELGGPLAAVCGLTGGADDGPPMTATLQVPGLDLTGARVVWEARDQEPHYGTSFTFTPTNSGSQWIEAEAQWPDGRRAFGVVNSGR